MCLKDNLIINKSILVVKALAEVAESLCSLSSSEGEIDFLFPNTVTSH